jgi:dTDP-4-amino-4,6-dideoxygalactose transaminase
MLEIPPVLCGHWPVEYLKADFMMNVPFADLHQQYLSIKPEIDAAIAGIIEKSAFVRGPVVEKFEADYAQLMEAQHCVSCADGTAAIYIGMRALGVQPGDEVITTAHSWISTSETITQAGGSVVFCDTGRDSFTIDPADIEARITPRTVGIIPVHLYGQAADMDAIMAIAKKHNLWVIEDCAQAHLATYKGRKVGTFGNLATWSFYPGKNLGAMGDAGAITTNDAALARHMACIARHGGVVKGSHEIEGINSRLDGMQAAILSVKLPNLAGWTKERQRVAARYDAQLAGLAGLDTPVVGEGRGHVYHLYVVRHDDRDGLAAHLKANGVASVINYPVALPFLQAYERLNHRPEDFPNAYANQSRILSLPVFAEMTSDQIDYVAQHISDFAKG